MHLPPPVAAYFAADRGTDTAALTDVFTTDAVVRDEGASHVGRADILAWRLSSRDKYGELETVLYVVRGRARMRWGERLEFSGEAGPGDFIYVPPFVPHQEINASTDEPLSCVLVRSDSEAVVVNLDIDPVEKPEGVPWVDPIHKG